MPFFLLRSINRKNNKTKRDIVKSLTPDFSPDLADRFFTKLAKEVIMLKKQLIMAFLAGAVFVGAGLLIVGPLSSGTQGDVPSSSQPLTQLRKTIEAQHLAVNQLIPKPLGAPIAYGFIDGNGKIVAGSGNFTCEWRGTGYYISITNFNYIEERYLTFVTPAHQCGVSATTAQGNNELRIELLGLGPDGPCTNTQSAFQFITYKIP